jgi:hypothetical protein
MKTKVILIVLLFCFGVISHLNAGSAYDLNGEWEAVITKTGMFESRVLANEKDVITISQQGDQFVGVRTVGGKFVGKNEHMIKGKLKYKMVDEVFVRYVSDPVTFDLSWIDGRATITENGHKIEIQAVVGSTACYETVTLTKKN